MEAGVVQAVKGSSEALAYMFTYNLHSNVFGWPPGGLRVAGVDSRRLLR